MNNENENKELEFDPTESEAFYENLEAALEVGEPEPEELPVIEVPVEDAPTEGEEASAWDDEELPELVFAEDLFQADETEISEETISEDGMQNEGSPEDSQDEFDVDEELFLGVDAALTEQIENEFGSAATTKEKSVGGKIKAFFQLVPTWTKVLVSVILVILLSVGFLFGTNPGRTLFSKVVAKVIFMFIETVPDATPTPSPMETPENTPGITETVTPAPTGTVGPTAGPTGTIDPTIEPTVEPTGEPTIGPTATPTLSPTPTPVPVMDSEDVINILLLGVENIYGSKFGRSDAILVASINKETGKIKLVSFLRDTWVQIPGEADDKLNAAYAHGGASLMMETIELNFQIDIDSYVVINFSGFEEMIDELGGLRISLTPAESDYLNTTRYISNADERNTVAGYQMMTGSQVLGYCRVRNVPTANGLKYDFGRTYRHRVVLKALFDKYKEKNFVELLTVMRKCFSYVTAPESLESLAAECLRIVMEKKTLDFDTKQIPASGHFSETTIHGKDAIKPHIDNPEILQEFLYGEDAD